MNAKIENGCIGCGLCVNTCPNVFRMTDEGVAEVFEPLAPSDEACAQKAADSCPVNVIMIEK